MDPNDPQNTYKSNEILYWSRRTKRTKSTTKLKRWKGKPADLDAKVLELGTMYNDQKRGFGFTAEGIAFYLGIHVHEIKQSLHRLNLAGKVSQAIRNFAHDNNRNPTWYGGSDSGWAANRYSPVKKA
jgi:hypothetical protein